MTRNLLAFALIVLALAGCTAQGAAVKSTASIMLTRPAKLPPADTKSQIPEHEVWCYKTMADTECYTKAQDVPPGRLVNVEPQNLYPLTPDTYRDELQGRRPAPATVKPVALGSTAEAPAKDNKPGEGDTYLEKLLGYKIF